MIATLKLENLSSTLTIDILPFEIGRPNEINKQSTVLECRAYTYEYGEHIFVHIHVWT